MTPQEIQATAFYRDAIRRLPASTDTAGFVLRTRVTDDMEGLMKHGPITIGIVGDSVSHGCFAAPRPQDYHAVYHNRLRLLMAERYPTVPVTVVNAAVGGQCAPFGVFALQERVLYHRPDLVIVCFGLNDVNGTVETYTDSLGRMFSLCREAGVDCIYMTPNMLNAHRSPQTEARYFDYAQKTADMQNDGRMDTLISAGREVARTMGVPVADAYAIWQDMNAAGIDTTELLCNRINHPSWQMHALFAELLYARLFGEPFVRGEGDTYELPVAESGMYAGAEAKA